MGTMNYFYVIGGCWFDSINGNSYNNAKVYFNGELIGYTGYQYGYGNDYLYRAEELIRKKYESFRNIKVVDLGIVPMKKSVLKNNMF